MCGFAMYTDWQLTILAFHFCVKEGQALILSMLYSEFNV